MSNYFPHEPYIHRCYTLAAQAVAKGNHPFGALLVHKGQIVLEAENSVHTDSDATAHAEMNLLRLAGSKLPSNILAQCTLYTSTEPCIMCSGGIYWAGIGTVVYGCAESDLAQFTTGDFLTPCQQIFARGRRPITVVGPVLPAEGKALHQNYW